MEKKHSVWVYLRESHCKAQNKRKQNEVLLMELSAKSCINQKSLLYHTGDLTELQKRGLAISFECFWSDLLIHISHAKKKERCVTA